MKKHSFIPKSHRPCVPGSTLQEPLGNEMCFLTEKKIFLNAILLISAKEDIVPNAFLKDIKVNDKLVRFFYDELGVVWDFSFCNSVLKFYTKECIIIPMSIYHRHPGIPKKHRFYDKHIAFFEVLDLWTGNLLGQKRDHHHNTSKMYQTAYSDESDQSFHPKRSLFRCCSADVVFPMSMSFRWQAC